MQAQPDRRLLSKRLWRVRAYLSERWSGFVRAGYDNRTDYDAYYSPGSPIDTRKLYSQSWDAGLL